MPFFGNSEKTIFAQTETEYMSDGLVIIPTYNEIENIEAIIRAVFVLRINYDVLIVDDNSPDGTSAEVKRLQEEFSERLFLEIRKEKSGLGTAYIHGFKWAIAKKYDYIFEMDADFSHTPSDLLRLYAACKNGADVAVGSRYKKGVNVVDWPLHRVLLSYGASFYVKMITGMRVDDPTAGFVCYKRTVLEELDLDSIRFVGYAFQIEMKFRAYVKNYKIDEVSIIFRDRIKGKSKMSSSIVSEAIFGVLKMKFRSMFQKNRF